MSIYDMEADDAGYRSGMPELDSCEERRMTTRGPHNRFAVGDRVKSFRGEIGTVTGIIESRAYRSKSHRVTVRWDELKHGRHTDPVEYYEEVFEPCSEESST